MCNLYQFLAIQSLVAQSLSLAQLMLIIAQAESLSTSHVGVSSSADVSRLFKEWHILAQARLSGRQPNDARSRLLGDTKLPLKLVMCSCSNTRAVRKGCYYGYIEAGGRHRLCNDNIARRDSVTNSAGQSMKLQV